MSEAIDVTTTEKDDPAVEVQAKMRMKRLQQWKNLWRS